MSVDRQIKSSFDTRAEAQLEADRLSAKFANLTIAVNDSQQPLIRESASEPENAETASGLIEIVAAIIIQKRGKEERLAPFQKGQTLP